MKISGQQLRKIIIEELDLLIEQEEEAPEAEEETEEVPIEDTEEPIEEEPPAEAEVSDEDGQGLSKSVDDELIALFVDFETSAINATKSGDPDEEGAISENLRLARLLFEQEEQPRLDVETFAADVARLVKNYDSLLDMKTIIMIKARDYITKNHTKDIADELMDVLDFRYDLSLEEKEENVAPLAIGASAQAAAVA